MCEDYSENAVQKSHQTHICPRVAASLLCRSCSCPWTRPPLEGLLLASLPVAWLVLLVTALLAALAQVEQALGGPPAQMIR